MRIVSSLIFMFLLGVARAQSWDMVPERSSLSLTAMVYGSPFVAEFTSFDADIVFDPADLGAARVTAWIDVAALVPAIADDGVYVSELQGADWFFSSQFPQAVFQSESFTDLGGGAYRVDGTLILRDQATPIGFDFQLQIRGDQADMQATILLDRFDLGLGLGTHPNTNTVEAPVSMTLNIQAVR